MSISDHPPMPRLRRDKLVVPNSGEISIKCTNRCTIKWLVPRSCLGVAQRAKTDAHLDLPIFLGDFAAWREALLRPPEPSLSINDCRLHTTSYSDSDPLTEWVNGRWALRAMENGREQPSHSILFQTVRHYPRLCTIALLSRRLVRA